MAQSLLSCSTSTVKLIWKQGCILILNLFLRKLVNWWNVLLQLSRVFSVSSLPFATNSFTFSWYLNKSNLLSALTTGSSWIWNQIYTRTPNPGPAFIERCKSYLANYGYDPSKIKDTPQDCEVMSNSQLALMVSQSGMQQALTNQFPDLGLNAAVEINTFTSIFDTLKSYPNSTSSRSKASQSVYTSVHFSPFQQSCSYNL